MPKRRRRSFTPQFRAQVVLEALAGLKSSSEIVRQHKLKRELVARRPTFPSRQGVFRGFGLIGPPRAATMTPKTNDRHRGCNPRRARFRCHERREDPA